MSDLEKKLTNSFLEISLKKARIEEKKTHSTGSGAVRASVAVACTSESPATYVCGTVEYDKQWNFFWTAPNTARDFHTDTFAFVH
jgi:hypothetical protein